MLLNSICVFFPRQLQGERRQIDAVGNELQQLICKHQRCRQRLIEAQSKAQLLQQSATARQCHQQSHTDESKPTHDALAARIAQQRQAIFSKRNEVNYIKSIEITAANKRRQDIRAKLSGVSQEVLQLRQHTADNHSKSLLAKEKTMASLRRKLHKAKKELDQRRFDLQSKKRDLQSEVEVHRQRHEALKRKLDNALTYQEHMDEPRLKKQDECQKAYTAVQLQQSDKRQKHSSTLQDIDLALSSALARRTQAQLLVSKLSEKEANLAKKLNSLCSKQGKIERMREHIAQLEREAENFRLQSQRKVQSTQAQLEEVRRASETGQLAQALAEQEKSYTELRGLKYTFAFYTVVALKVKSNFCTDQETTIVYLEQVLKKLDNKMQEVDEMCHELKSQLQQAGEKLQAEQQLAQANERKSEKILTWKRKFDKDDIKPTLYLKELKNRLATMKEEVRKEERGSQLVDGGPSGS
ncbi:hypothetical protein RvY_00015 [Ramazzottius varieornatus]|uniref:Uncharacterized protein n=1 Tax=Ramazzottius varieornatus TaxID=947166 RepID=A0A1D1ULS9_RAMVA|nr:hypothetical protein RvY_00015 [Ramazzottius varieornatus]